MSFTVQNVTDGAEPAPYGATPGLATAGLAPADPAAAGTPFSVGDGAQSLPADFYSTLQPASWRGQTFYVRGSRVRAGRRKALHEYPFRDGVYVEDLGRKGRLFAFEGFLVGDDVAQQMTDFLSLVDVSLGAGALVHPSFGLLTVEIIDFEGTEEWDEGRVWRFRAEFLEPVARGLQLQPNQIPDTGGEVQKAATNADAATVQQADATPPSNDSGASRLPTPPAPPATVAAPSQAATPASSPPAVNIDPGTEEAWPKLGYQTPPAVREIELGQAAPPEAVAPDVPAPPPAPAPAAAAAPDPFVFGGT